MKFTENMKTDDLWRYAH